MDKLAKLGSSVSSTESDNNERLEKTWTAIDRLSVKWKSDLSDKIKRNFFTIAGRVHTTIRTHHVGGDLPLREKVGKKMHTNATSYIEQILEAKYRKTATMRPPTSLFRTIQVSQREQCWRCKVELICEILQWASPHAPESVGKPTRTYQQQRCTDTECSREDQLESMDDWDEWWMSGKSMLEARHDNYQDVHMKIYRPEKTSYTEESFLENCLPMLKVCFRRSSKLVKSYALMKA